MQPKSILLSVVLCGYLYHIPETTAFAIVGQPLGRGIISEGRVRTRLQKKIAVGDDFAGYEESVEDDTEKGAQAAQAFFRELQARTEQPADSAIEDTAATRLPSVGTFDKRNPQLTVYTNGNGSATSSSAAAAATTTAKRVRLAPLPPVPTYGNPTTLSISGIIAVLLMSRFFWAQALVSGGVIAAYVLLVTVTSKNGGDSNNWMGASTGNNTGSGRCSYDCKKCCYQCHQRPVGANYIAS